MTIRQPLWPNFSGDKMALAKQTIAFRNSIPALDNMIVKIMSPKTTQGFVAWLLSDELTIVATHWDGSRTVPCRVDPSTCSCCRAGLGTRTKLYFQGFAQIELTNKQSRPGEEVSYRCVLVELTLFAINSYKELHGQIICSRGQQIHVYRTGQDRKAPVGFAILPKPLSSPNLPPKFSVEDALVKIWNGETKDPDRRKRRA